MSADEAGTVLADFAVTTTFEDLPASTVEAVKSLILDTVGVMIAGSGGDTVDPLLSFARRWPLESGARGSRIVGYGDTVSPYIATLVNAGMVHQWDLDDTHDTAVCHPSASTVPSSLAVAESDGPASGRDLLAAVAIGNEITTRIALAIQGTLWDFPWVRAPVVGIFGTAASASKLLGLDAQETHNAFGIALPQSAGTLECLQGDSGIRSIRDGLIYKDGVLAAYLASDGVRGDWGALEGTYGLYQAYFGGRYDRNRLLDGLGVSFETERVSLKPWPSCRHTHATLTALFEALGYAREHGHDVVSLVVRVGDGNQHLIRRVLQGQLPKHPIDALCDLGFIVGAALVFGDITPSVFRLRNMSDPRIADALRQVEFVYASEQSRTGTIEPGSVTVQLTSGEEKTFEVERALGHPDNPMSRDQMRHKLRVCAETAPIDYDEATLDRIVDMCEHLEYLDDVTSLVDLLV